MATKADKISLRHEKPRLNAGMVERVVSLAVLAIVVLAIVWGWTHRTDGSIDPEHGVGYALGIVGGSMMLLLLAYPLRKRARPASRAPGSVGFWFRLHMLLGLAGPLAIMYHSRFSWGALNSAVALGTMIVVASSGLIGRFFYSRVHRGYSQRKLELRALKDEMDALLLKLEHRGIPREEILARLIPFEQRAIAAGNNFWSSARAVVELGLATRLAQRRMNRAVLLQSVRGAKDVRLIGHEFFETVRRAAEFAFYDRLLRLWHLLHLPLFFLLVAAAILHVVAVHMY